MILANAHPKCGCNLGKKVLGGLGLKHEPGGLVGHRPLGALFMTKGGKWAALDKDHGYFLHAHVAFGSVPAGTKMVFSIRHPRNALVSFLRWAERRDDEKMPYRLCREHMLLLIREGPYELSLPWARSCAAFGLWAQDDGVCTVRFEEICHDGGASVARIAAYVGADAALVPKVYAGLYGNGSEIDGKPVYDGSSTWSGRWSDWREHWDAEIDRAWRETGGREVEQALGYG